MTLGLLLATLLTADFREHVIATDLKGGYQVVAADLNGDVACIGSATSNLKWYENVMK